MSDQPVDRVLLEGDTAFHHLLFGGPGGTVIPQGQIPISEFSAIIGDQFEAQKPMSFGPMPYGAAIRDIHQEKGVYLFLIEVAPGNRTMKWLQDNSPVPFGPGATYRDVTVSLPHSYFFVAMMRNGIILIQNSVFFRNTPMQSLNDKLCDCHFFNCSPNSYGVYCWICSQHYDRSKPRRKSLGQHACEFVDWFWFSGFNASSEHHEGSSFWSKNKDRIKDKRVQTMNAWERASRRRPYFATDVPWIDSGLTVKGVYQDILQNVRGWNPTNSSVYANLMSQRSKEEDLP